MTLARRTDVVEMQRKLQREIEHAPEPVRNAIQIPLEGAVDASVRFGDILLADPTDDGRTDRGGTIIWLHAEPSWEKIEELWIPHIWGESAKHYQILLDLCAWGIAEGYTQPVKYGITPHPINDIATRYFVRPDQIKEDFATTTFAEAYALGLANQRAFEGRR